MQPATRSSSCCSLNSWLCTFSRGKHILQPCPYISCRHGCSLMQTLLPAFTPMHVQMLPSW